MKLQIARRRICG